ncbi:MAG: hypothetical protein MJ082_00695 [Clostridia bacterium]|nr:hypothetical protein [Clostridia bacterium]
MKKLIPILLAFSLLLGVLIPISASAEGGSELLFEEDFENESTFQTNLLAPNSTKIYNTVIEQADGNHAWQYQYNKEVVLTPELLGLSAADGEKYKNFTTLTVSFTLEHGEGNANGYFSIYGKDSTGTAKDLAVVTLGAETNSLVKLGTSSSGAKIGHGEKLNFTLIVTNDAGNMKVIAYVNGICTANVPFKNPPVFSEFTGFRVTSTSSAARWIFDNISIYTGNAVEEIPGLLSRVTPGNPDLDSAMMHAYRNDGSSDTGFTKSKTDPFVTVAGADENSYWNMSTGATLKMTAGTLFPVWKYFASDNAYANVSDHVTVSMDICSADASATGYLDLRVGNSSILKPYTVVSGQIKTVGGTMIPIAVSDAPLAETFTNFTFTVDYVENKIDYYKDGAFVVSDPITPAQSYYNGLWVNGKNLFIDNFTIDYGKPGINAASVSLGSDVKLNFTAALPASVPATATVTLNPGTADETVLDVSEKSNGMEKVYSVGLAPQCIGDTVRIDVKDAQNTVLFTKDYSVKEYCVAVLEGADTELSALVSDLLVYGAEAQKYTGYKADALVTADLSLTPSTYAKPTDVHKDSSKVGEDTAFLGANVMFDYANRILFRFRTDTLEGKTLWLKVGEGEETEISASAVAAVNDDYVYTTDDIKAINFASVFTVSIKDGDTVLASATYSITDYVISMDENAKIGDLVKALYNYGQSARAYAD